MRTVGMLNQIGAVRSVNGKGTRVFTIGERCDPPNFASPVVRRNLSFFVQSFELLIYTCEDVTRNFLAAFQPGKRKALIAQLEENQRTGRCELTLWHYLLCIAQNSRIWGIREIFGTIYGLFL